MNLISYFKHKSYRLSFHSVFSSVLKVTEIEACVWINHRCLCVALGGFSGIVLLLCFFTPRFCSVDSGPLVPQLARCLHCSGTWPLWSSLWSGEREGRQGPVKRLWVFGASQFRFCFDRYSRIQTFLWNEPEVGMGRANGWWRGNQETIQKFSTQPLPGFTCFLLACYMNTSVEVCGNSFKWNWGVGSC